jgi:hypothetical protein
MHGRLWLGMALSSLLALVAVAPTASAAEQAPPTASGDWVLPFYGCEPIVVIIGGSNPVSPGVNEECL